MDMSHTSSSLNLRRQHGAACGDHHHHHHAQFAAYCHSKWQAVQFLLPNADHQLMHVFLTLTWSIDCSPTCKRS